MYLYQKKLHQKGIFVRKWIKSVILSSNFFFFNLKNENVPTAKFFPGYRYEFIFQIKFQKNHIFLLVLWPKMLPKLAIISVLIFSVSLFVSLFIDTIVGQGDDDKIYYEIQVEKIPIPKKGGGMEENVVCEMTSDCDEPGRSKVGAAKIIFDVGIDRKMIFLYLRKKCKL